MEMTGQEISRESSGKAENPSEVDAVLGSSNENGEDAMRKYADKQLQRTYELFEKFTEKSEAAYTSMKEDYEMLKNKETNYKEMTKKLDDVHFVDVVKLDVGGEEFKTGLQTLLKYPDSLFATQFSQSLKLKQTSNESFFIDRDGSYFRHIMNYMRTSTVTSKMKELKAELMEEAKFFGLSGLVKMLSEEEPELEKGEAGGEENKDVGMIILEDHSNQTSKLLEDAKKSLKEGQDALKNDINLLEESKENFLKMSERLQDVHFSEMIQLNVGGHIFKTSISTLQKYPNTILATMFSQPFKLEKQKDGSYFIDRDGTHFRHILNYLRFGRLPRKVIDEIGDELLEEVKYYNIEGLYKEIWNMPSIELKVGSKSYYTTRNIVHKDESFASAIFGSPTDGGAYLIQWDIKHMEEILKFLENGELPKDIVSPTLSQLFLEAQVLNMLNLQRYLSSFFHSKILDGKQYYIKKLSEWLSEKEKTKCLPELLYSFPKEGYKSESFFKIAADIEPKIIIAETKNGCIFGGYTSIGWDINGNKYCDNESFLFSLKSLEWDEPLILKANGDNVAGTRVRTSIPKNPSYPRWKPEFSLHFFSLQQNTDVLCFEEFNTEVSCIFKYNAEAYKCNDPVPATNTLLAGEENCLLERMEIFAV